MKSFRSNDNDYEEVFDPKAEGKRAFKNKRRGGKQDRHATKFDKAKHRATNSRRKFSDNTLGTLGTLGTLED